LIRRRLSVLLDLKEGARLRGNAAAPDRFNGAEA
jgi:hypothetical protein